MAASNLNLGKASGGVLNIQPADGTTNTSLVLPASGVVVATDVAVTDNAIARYDGTTGKVQNSGVIIDDSNNLKANSFAAVGETKTHFIDTDNNVGGTNAFRISRYSNSGTYEATPFRIDVNGNVGIGVTPSAWRADRRALEIGATGALYTYYATFYSTSNSYVNSSGNYIYKISDYATMATQASGNHTWYTAPSGTAGSNIPWTNTMTLDASGNLLLQSGTGGLGYGTGAGISVTQQPLGSKSAAVTANRPSGKITMHNAALAAGASVEFVVNNSLFNSNTGDTLTLDGYDYGSSYRIEHRGAAGAFSIRVTNITGVSLSEPLVIVFNIIKGAIA